MSTGARTQAYRAMSLTPPASIPADQLLLVGIQGEEAISRVFSFRLDLLAENDKPVPFDQILGKKVAIRLGQPDATIRYFHGIVSRMGQGRRDELFTAYQMEVVPEAWLLTRVARSRIFSQQTVPQILAVVLAGLKLDVKLTGTYEPRDYCVQYRETDFHFASRLMEEEGIFFFFDHDKDGHTMVVADAPAAHPLLSPAILYDDLIGGVRDEMRVRDWDKTQELRSGKYTLWDHCFELPHKNLEAGQTIQPDVQVGTVSHKLMPAQGEKLELYDYPGEYAQRFDGVGPGGGDRASDIPKIFQDNQRTVGIRMQEEAAQALVARGTSNVTTFQAGSRFNLAGHWDADGAYVLTSVVHSARMSNDYLSGGGECSYENSFRALPAGLPYRPQRVTPRPVVHGTQTAVVVGPAGEEIFPDKYARVKVQFHWDREGKDDPASSCWIRVASPWAGKNWGMVAIPRVGQEVVVAFEEGDPDRPLIVGSVYNADMMPPYSLPANKTQTGVKSRSSLAGTPENYNEIRFEDKKGDEQVFLHAEKDFVREVENNDSLIVGIPGPSLVEGNQTTTVFKDRTTTVKNGDEALTIQKGNRTVSVDMGDDTHNIKMGDRSVEIAMGNDSLRIKMGNQSVKLDLGQSTTEAMQSITLKVGQSSIVIDQMGVTIKGMMVSVEGQVQAEVKGLMTSVQADAMLTVKGGITMIN